MASAPPAGAHREAGGHGYSLHSWIERLVECGDGQAEQDDGATGEAVDDLWRWRVITSGARILLAQHRFYLGDPRRLAPCTGRGSTGPTRRPGSGGPEDMAPVIHAI